MKRKILITVAAIVATIAVIRILGLEVPLADHPQIECMRYRSTIAAMHRVETALHSRPPLHKATDTDVQLSA